MNDPLMELQNSIVGDVISDTDYIQKKNKKIYRKTIKYKKLNNTQYWKIISDLILNKN